VPELGERGKKSKMAAILQRLLPRWFVVRDAKDPRGPTLLQPRWAMSYLRGPMTRQEIKKARQAHESPPAEPETRPSEGGVP
jgi:hypothetical protein